MKPLIKLSPLIVVSLFTLSLNAAETSSGSSMQGGEAPADARDPNAYANGYEYRGMAGWEDTDELSFYKVIADQFEYRNGGNDASNLLRWDIQGWRGTDYQKLWIKFEGEDETASGSGDLELQTLYSYAIDPFWDVQLGLRYDNTYSTDITNSRLHAVIGLQGLAPYWFEMEPALYISENGDISARVTSTYDLLLTQRLILQPRIEINVSANDVPEFDVGKGVNDLQLGFRLRYEIKREIAPYIGVSWNTAFGNTKHLIQANNEKVDNLYFVAGLRFWF